MAKYSSSINYKITTSLDASGITKLQAELNKLENEFKVLHSQDFVTNKQRDEALRDIKRIQDALQKAFNPKLGMLNTKALTSELTKTGKTLEQTFKSLGPQGTSAMAQLYGQLGKIDTGMKSVSKTTDKIFNTLGNTVRWGVIASGFQYVLNSAHNAVTYMKDLDESLTNIRMVTDESKESMRQFAQYANKAAQSLGNTTVAYTDAALIYAQQGYNLNDQKTLANYTLMTANATGQETSEVSTQMTSMINGFHLSVNEVGGALDVLAKVANTSAADMEELATATAKVASTASTLGVSQEELTAQIATIVSVTREAPENVGNALKTIYARFGDLQLGETLEDGSDLGKVSSTLEKIGVQVLDDTGAMRDMGAIMEDLMSVWDTLSTADKQATAVTVAGKYQYNRLMALMENSDMYSGYLNDAKTSEGTLEMMQSEYMESLEGKTNALIASLQGALSTLFNQDDFGVMIDGLTEVVNLFTEFTEVIGGSSAMLTSFGAIAANVFNDNIGRSIANVIGNREKTQMMKSNIDAVSSNAKAGLYSKGVSEDSERMKVLAAQIEGVGARAGIMNQEQFDAYNEGLQKHIQLIEQAEKADEEYKASVTGVRGALNALGIDANKTDEEIIGMAQTLKSGGTPINNLSELLLGLSDKMSNAQTSAISLANSLEKMDENSGDDWDKIIQKADKTKGELEELIQSFKELDLADEYVEYLEMTFIELENAIQGNTQDVKELTGALEKAGTEINTVRTGINSVMQKKNFDVDDVRQKSNTKASANAALDAHVSSQQGMIDNLAVQEAASGIADVTSAMLSMFSAWQMINNLDDIWTNEDLELGEKIGQTFTNGLMATSMLAMGVMELTNGFKALKASGVITSAASSIAAFTGVEKIATFATKGFAASLATVAAPIAIAIAAIAALTIGIKALIDVYNKDQIAAEKAVEDAKAAKQVYQDLNTEVTNLKDNISNYQGARKALSDLKEGTEEWKKAVQDTNTEVLNLLDTYPELAKYVTRSNEGVLSISQEGLDALVNEKEEAAKDARNASLIADLGANQARTKAQETSVRRQVDWWQSDPSGLTGGTMMNLSESQMSVLEQGYESGVSIGDAEAVAKLLGVDVTNPMVTAITENADRLIGFWEDKSNQEAADSQKQQEIMQGLLNEQEGYNQETQENNGQLLAELARMSGPDSALYQETLAAQKAKSTEDLAYDYAEQIGMRVSNIEVDRNGLGKDDDTVTITDMEGNVKQFSRTMLESSVAGAEAMEAAAEKWNQVADKLLGFDSSSAFGKIMGDEGYGAVAGWKKGDAIDTSNLTQNEAERLRALTEGEGGLTRQELFGDMSDEDIANIVAQAGYTGNTAEADYLTDYSNAIIQSTDTQTIGSSAAYVRGRKKEDGDWLQGFEPHVRLEGQKYTDYREAHAPQADAFLETVQKSSDLDLGFREEILDYEDYTKGLIQLGDSMGGMTKEVDAAKDALENYHEVMETCDETSQEAIDAALELRDAEGELRDKLKSKEWTEAKDDLQEYIDVLKTGKEDSEEYQEASQKITDVLSDLTGYELDSEFFETYKQEILDWINNVEGAGAKVNALINLEYGATEAKANLESVGLSYDALKAGIESGEIKFNAHGEADFSQVTAAFGELWNEMDSNEIKAQKVAALLSALGDAEITLTKEGEKNPLKLGTPPSMTDDPAGFVKWYADLIRALDTGWTFSTIDMPESDYNWPTSSGSGSPGSPKSSGGGGGGGGKSYEPKTEEHLEAEPDRYQNVNAHLDRLSNNLEEIANEQDRLVGRDMLENMEKQVDLIQQQAEWHQKKLDIQREEAAELRNELGQEYGITFDSEGYMTNYQEIHKQLVAEYNALVDQYNATSDEEGQEKIKEKMDAVKEKIDKFNEAWGRYDELMNNEIPESINTLEDLEDQIEDLRIEAFNAYVEASNNIKDIKDAWADYVGFVSGLKPDSPFRSLIEDAEKYENSIDLVAAKQENLEELLKLSSQYQPGGVITSDNPFGENSAEYYNALREAYDAYIEAVIDAESLYYDQIDDIIEAYDEIADKIEKRMENYAQLGEQLDHYASVIETLYGEEDYDNLLALKRANQDILESSVEQARKNLSMWQGELSKYNKETQPEIWEAIHEKVVEAQGELNGLVEEAAQNTAEILEMAIDKTIKEWKDTMLGGDSTWMETQWEMSKELAEQYLDAVEETYEIEKLRSKYNDLANSTMDLNLRKRINEQMELELEYLREKDKLSEFDVNYANAKLEILQKQIALEEAQANKNQMKLRRDSQGNYSYVYAADKDDVSKAESELLDAEFNAYDMSKENYVTNYDNYISAVNSAAERIKEINANTLLSEEEKAKRTQEIYDWLNEYLSGIAEQIGVSQQGMIESVAWLAMDTTGIAGETFANISAMMQEDWTAALGAIGVATSENFDYIINHIDEFLAKTKEKWTEFEDHTYEWALNVQDIAEEGIGGFRQVDDVILTIRNDMKDLNEETETFFGLINDDLGTIDKAVGKLSEYESQILGLKDSTSKIRAELNEANKLLLEKEKEIENLKGQLSGNNDDGGNGNGGSGGSSGSGGSGGSGGGDGKISVGDVVTYKGGRYYYDSAGTAPSGNRGPGKKVTVTYLNWGSKYPIHVESKDSAFGWLKQDQLEGFDTGGYTGKWGTDGRLAMLHQKELVLNAQDTENVLAAVSAVREIVSAIKSDSLSSFVSSFRNGNIASTNGNNIEQNVSIYADFPAAESAAEIKAALEGLTQQAIQYAKRTR